MRERLSSDERHHGRRGVLCARLALAEADGWLGTDQAERLRAELAEFDEAAKYRVVHGGRLPYRDDDSEDTGEGEAAG
jgi:hypothetical protein